MDFEIAELQRQLNNLVRPGSITAVDASKARVRVKTGELTTAWLPWLTQRAGTGKNWWPPEVGEQVLLISPGGNPAQGFVLTGLYSTDKPAPSSDPNIETIVFKNGDSVTHNSSSGATALNVSGSLTVTAGGDISLAASGNVSINGSRIDLN